MIAKIKSSIRPLIPSNLFRGLRRVFFRQSEHVSPAVDSKQMPVGKHSCPLCKERFDSFTPFLASNLKELSEYGYIHSLFTQETFNFLAYGCPRCEEPDRNRLYAIYIAERLGKRDVLEKTNFIEFAPSLAIGGLIKSYPRVEYRSADFFRADVDDRVDITNMTCYKSNSVDAYLCSHVLEHVEEDKKAFAELYRILKPGGWGILMAPTLTSLKDIYENSEYKTDAERWKHFGQYDHFRIYSHDGFVSRIEDAGFTLEQKTIEYFGADVFEEYGLSKNSVLYVVGKK